MFPRRGYIGEGDAASWHFRDMARSGTNGCFRKKSGRVADIITMTGFGPLGDMIANYNLSCSKGAPTMSMTSAEFGKFIADETEKWGKVIRAANIKAE